MWDHTNPILIHGFLSATVSDGLLKPWLKQSGTFLLRFSSKGGLAVDYVRDGRIQKTHWKFEELTDVNALKKKLYDAKRYFVTFNSIQIPTQNTTKSFPPLILYLFNIFLTFVSFSFLTLNSQHSHILRDAPYLLSLIDTSEPFSTKCHPKESVFPLDDTSNYVDSGYQTNENQSSGYVNTEDDNENASGYVNVVNVADVMDAEKTTKPPKFVLMDTKWN